MNGSTGGIGRRKRQVAERLRDPRFGDHLDQWAHEDARKMINPLISFFCSTDETMRWHAVSAAGVLLASLAQKDAESARVVIRRFLWSLNDESGGIGWGVPEAMGEALARSALLAREYGRILLSFIKEDENYLEHLPLQQGALWAVARFAQVRSDLAAQALPDVRRHLNNPDPHFRALALWILTAWGGQEDLPAVQSLQDDVAPVRLYRNEEFHETTVGALAHEAARCIRRCLNDS
ncbi:hypothetical protein SAMN02746041_01014 [Desulfacinum hydrothermale DSM 13146]|uniref:HEAT-like repeat-containing protein n=1 Tax=Desulfacinum hydrothermale DSM 13146 TaxID=1121390 RepID=A0A1W1XAD1_9BACT|nr:DVU0298 family protein [Desulfacinum hydrothermale]SMC20800.1 hypothetical protein SAMN02746041_01014 [Desulfacinum hydrothermale DSM 13146]